MTQCLNGKLLEGNQCICPNWLLQRQNQCSFEEGFWFPLFSSLQILCIAYFIIVIFLMFLKFKLFLGIKILNFLQCYSYLFYAQIFYDWKHQFIFRIMFYLNGGVYSQNRQYSNQLKTGASVAIIIGITVFIWILTYVAIPIKGGFRYNSFLVYLKKQYSNWIFITFYFAITPMILYLIIFALTVTVDLRLILVVLYGVLILLLLIGVFYLFYYKENAFQSLNLPKKSPLFFYIISIKIYIPFIILIKTTSYIFYVIALAIYVLMILINGLSKEILLMVIFQILGWVLLICGAAFPIFYLDLGILLFFILIGIFQLIYVRFKGEKNLDNQNNQVQFFPNRTIHSQQNLNQKLQKNNQKFIKHQNFDEDNDQENTQLKVFENQNHKQKKKNKKNKIKIQSILADLNNQEKQKSI